MFVNFSEETKHLLKQAEAEKDNLNHPYVGSEHLLLSILKDSKLTQIFKKLQSMELKNTYKFVFGPEYYAAAVFLERLTDVDLKK